MPDNQPGNLDDIRKDTKLCAALMNHMKATHSLENFLFYYDKGNPEALYTKYISKDAKAQVNLPSAVQKACDSKKTNFEDPIWPKLIKAAKVEIAKMVQIDVIPRFYTSKEYQEYAKKSRMGDPKKAAKLLGISNVKLLEQGMAAAAIGNEKEAIKLLEKLAKEEKLKEKAATLLKNLKQSGLC